MSDQGEKMCPLCAEEMDLTDQQLKPCKCGYEICVWCWHHIMDMAEKDDTEGRCPACRVPYDKEKIVGMAANCERLVVENNVEKKVKLQKTKTKMAEERKQLTSVRVIRRNLAYIVGLPLNLADEDLLQRKEYFGQYGRVLKVSISRTAAGSIQHFPNNTCSVYVTYSKEDEAVRCIQSVHDFTLDGRSLRACFGTTKYCHAWLRSVPCNNPDCLYLHEIGLQEDSFTKDEIISAYTRSRVQQITGSSNLQRSSGNVLPPPIDDYNNSCSASPGKPTTKNVSNNLASIIKCSPPNGTSVKSVALPAAASWGMRASNNHAPASASVCSNGLSKQKPDTLSSSLPFSLSASSTMDTSKAQIEMGKKILLSQESQTKQLKSKVSTFEADKVYNDMDFRTTASDAAVSSVGASSLIPTSTDSNRCSNLPPNIKPFDCNGKSRGSDSEVSADVATNAKIHNLSTILSSMSDNKQLMDEQADVIKSNSQLPDLVLMKSPRPGNSESLQYYAEQFREPFSPDKKAEASLRFESQSLDSKCYEVQNGIVSDQRLNDSKYIDNMASHGAAHFLNGWNDCSSQLSSFNERPVSLDTKSNGNLTPHASDVFPASSGYTERPAGTSKTAGLPHLLSNGGKAETMRRFDCVGANVHNDASVDMGESSIISNILSMDFDAWDDSLTSPQDLAAKLSDSDQQQGSHKNSIPWKVQNNQSRFSFARQGESKNNLSDFQPSFNSIGGLPNIQSHNQNIAGDGYPHFDKRGDENVFSTTHVPESNNFLTSHSIFSSTVSRDQVSAPPGFSVPSRAPPPGFSSFEKMSQSFDIATGNRMFDSSSLLRNPYHAPETVNMTCTGDIEFIDPAILAVGKGRLPAGANSPGLDMRSNVTPQISTFENETRLQLLMQRSLSLQQNLRYSGNRDQFSSINDSFGIPSRLMEQQSQASNVSPFSQISAQRSRSGVMSNGHWDGWNEVQNGNNLAVAELLRNERLGFNNLYAGLEDPKVRMPNSSDLYNRTFGM